MEPPFSICMIFFRTLMSFLSYMLFPKKYRQITLTCSITGISQAKILTRKPFKSGRVGSHHCPLTGQIISQLPFAAQFPFHLILPNRIDHPPEIPDRRFQKLAAESDDRSSPLTDTVCRHSSLLNFHLLSYMIFSPINSAEM